MKEIKYHFVISSRSFLPSGVEQKQQQDKQKSVKEILFCSPLLNNDSSISSLILRNKNNFLQLRGISFSFPKLSPLHLLFA